MRLALIGLAALTLGACGQERGDDAATAACALGASREIAWSNPEPQDSVSARAEGPSCGQAALVLVVRNSAGDPLWTYASTYRLLTAGDAVPLESAPEITAEDVQSFLDAWADVTLMNTSRLPEWRADAATLSESAETFAYDTPYDREAYEMLRTRDLPMLCYAAGAESSQCVIIDPASRQPALMAAYGP